MLWFRRSVSARFLDSSNMSGGIEIEVVMKPFVALVLFAWFFIVNNSYKPLLTDAQLFSLTFLSEIPANKQRGLTASVLSVINHQYEN